MLRLVIDGNTIVKSQQEQLMGRIQGISRLVGKMNGKNSLLHSFTAVLDVNLVMHGFEFYVVLIVLMVVANKLFFSYKLALVERYLKIGLAAEIVASYTIK